MQLAAPLPKIASRAAKANLAFASAADTSHTASAEIGAYISIRERLLADAEEQRSPSVLDRAAIANNFVAACLKPARSPYQAQCLPEAEAARERKRCEAVKTRISRLRETLAHAA